LRSHGILERKTLEPHFVFDPKLLDKILVEEDLEAARHAEIQRLVQIKTAKSLMDESSFDCQLWPSVASTFGARSSVRPWNDRES
jgi:hypothetical protein